MWKILIPAVLLLATPAMGQTPPPQARMEALIKDYEAWRLSTDPITAGLNGDNAALAKLPDISLAADARRKVALDGFETRLKAIDPKGLDDNAAINHDFLERIIGNDLAGLKFDEARIAFSSDNSWDGLFAYLAGVAPMKSRADGEAWLARLALVPAFYEQGTANARRGIATGFTQPKSTVELVLAQARKAAAAPVEADPLVTALDRLPATVAEKAAMKTKATALVRDQIRPAQQRLVSFVETEYLPKARPGLGAGSLPGGRDYYAWLVRRYTTTDLTPDQVHAIGVREVARIRAEMETTMKEAGFKGTLPEFLAYLRSDPRFYAKTPQELLEKASEIAKRIDDKLPAWFATLPRLTYGVRPVPAEIAEGYTTGRYFPGSPVQGVAGGYMVNTSHLDQRALYELPALTLHEAVPGHHLQIALAQELSDLPSFRRDADMTAFTEGWGLYSEKLGVDMGVYRDPYERFGRLSYEMWRACRLVSDTGIHWLGWSLDKARECFTQNTALSPLNIEVELARYVSWPGQATAYKIGEMKLLEEREKARKALGDRFDIRRFHDAVLLNGPLPLDLLDNRIDRWIAAEKKGP